MSNLKTHFAVKPPFDASETAACGRGRNGHMTADTYGVTCLSCKGKDSFILAEDEAKSARHARFMAQEPRQMAEPWKDRQVICSKCSGDLFRYGDRTCYGHYQNFHCAACGHVESRLTETGMSF
jgi:hypothetical protein